MKVLIIGGSGFVGRLIVPLLKEKHRLRIFDLGPPADTTLDFVQGDVTDSSTLLRAASGMEAIVYLAMGKDEKGDVYVSAPAFDVNVKGVHLACECALRSGVKRFIYMSTLSIYDDDGRRRFDSEEEIPDSSNVYGLTKFMGEEVCRFFSRVWGLDCIALRLNYPTEPGRYAEVCRRNPACGATSGPDLARAVLSALECKHSGFDAVFIAGDPEGRRFNISKAKRLLGWEPSERP